MAKQAQLGIFKMVKKCFNEEGIETAMKPINFAETRSVVHETKRK